MSGDDPRLTNRQRLKEMQGVLLSLNDALAANHGAESNLEDIRTLLFDIANNLAEGAKLTREGIRKTEQLVGHLEDMETMEALADIPQVSLGQPINDIQPQIRILHESGVYGIRVQLDKMAVGEELIINGGSLSLADLKSRVNVVLFGQEDRLRYFERHIEGFVIRVKRIAEPGPEAREQGWPGGDWRDERR